MRNLAALSRTFQRSSGLARVSSYSRRGSNSANYKSLFAAASVALLSFTGFTATSVSMSDSADPAGAGGDCKCKSKETSSDCKKWPIYRRSDVQKHQTIESGALWVTYKDGVYDVTDFISSHPGGRDRLMLAVGGDLNNFWKIPSFRLHYKSPLVMELLSEMRIGTLHPDDVIAGDSNLEYEAPKYSNNKIYDCIIVGSGVSGLQTRYSLVKEHGLNNENILILEAQDYVGGRVRQMTEFIKGVKIDVGAEFLHGTDTELTRFAKAHNEPIKEIYCWAHGDGGPLQEPVNNGYGLYFIGGKDGKKRLVRYDDKDPQFQKLNESLWNIAELNENDYSDNHSLHDYLLSLGLSEEMMTMAEAGYANTICTNAKDLSLKRMIKWSRMWNNEGEEDGDFSFDNSMGCVVDALKKEAQIELNSAVAEIQYAKSESDRFSELVKVKTINGTEYYTKSIVITSSPHVLKSGLMKFDPPLSTDIQEALGTTNMNNIIKVVLKFEKPAWPKHLSGMIMIDPDFLLPEIWFRDVTGKTAPGEPAQAYAIGFTTSEYAKRIASMPKNEVIKKCVAQLDTIVSHLETEHMAADVSDKSKLEDPKSIPMPSSVFLGGMFWDWNPDHHPYIGGGYASPKAATNTDLQDRFRLPYGTKKNIYFAGEATSLPGATAHSALGSGIRAAKQIKGYLDGNTQE